MIILVSVSVKLIQPVLLVRVRVQLEPSGWRFIDRAQVIRTRPEIQFDRWWCYILQSNTASWPKYILPVLQPWKWVTSSILVISILEHKDWHIIIEYLNILSKLHGSAGLILKVDRLEIGGGSITTMHMIVLWKYCDLTDPCRLSTLEVASSQSSILYSIRASTLKE